MDRSRRSTRDLDGGAVLMTFMVGMGVTLLANESWAGGPKNDDCADAILIVEGDAPMKFSTVDATTDGPGDCSTDKDIWYRYLSLNDRQVTIDICDSGYDTHLSVYETTDCPPQGLLACEDDNCNVTRTRVDFSAFAGQEYLIRVGGCCNQSGPGTIETTTTALPNQNDECEDAIAIFDGETLFNTHEASLSDPPLAPPCADENGTLNFGGDIWYFYTATCNGTVTVNQCTADYDGRMAVYFGSNCPPDDDDLAGCNDDACGAGQGAIVPDIPVLCGDVLTVRVGGWGVGTVGTGSVVITCTGDGCEDPCPWDLASPDGVGPEDLIVLLGAWGDVGHPADFLKPKGVGPEDLIELLGNWGPCP